MTRTPPRNRFGQLLKALRRRKHITLAALSAAAGIDAGNLSRMERGQRKASNLPRLVAIREDRFETLKYGRFTYLGWENPLHGLPAHDVEPRQFGLTEAAFEIGRISASHGVKKITVKSADGSEWFFPIREEEEPPQG